MCHVLLESLEFVSNEGVLSALVPLSVCVVVVITEQKAHQNHGDYSINLKFHLVVENNTGEPPGAPPFAPPQLRVPHPSPVLGRVGTTNACTMCFGWRKGFTPAVQKGQLSQVPRLRSGFRQRAQSLACPERLSAVNESNGPARRLNFSRRGQSGQKQKPRWSNGAWQCQ